MKKVFQYFISAILAITLSSCIAIRTNTLPVMKSEELNIASVKKPKIFLDWKFHTSFKPFLQKTPQNILDQAAFEHKKMFESAIKDSGCCDVVYDKDKADISIRGAFYNETSNAGTFFAIVTGASLYTIPSWMNIKVKVSATVKKSKESKNYDLKDSMLFSQWLPFIVAMPFRGNPIKEETEMNKNIYRNLIMKMKEDNFL